MTDRELMQMALDALQYIYTETTADEDDLIHAAINALRARLEQPEPEPWKCGCGANLYIDENGKPRSKVQLEKDVPETNFGNMEPVAWRKRINGGYVCCDDMTDFPTCEDHGWEPLYTAPPQREWQGLTDEEIYAMVVSACSDGSAPSFDEYMHEDAAVVRDVARAIESKLKQKNA